MSLLFTIVNIKKKKDILIFYSIVLICKVDTEKDLVQMLELF